MTIESSISSTPARRSPANRGGTDRRIWVVRYEKGESGAVGGAAFDLVGAAAAAAEEEEGRDEAFLEDEATAFLAVFLEGFGVDITRAAACCWRYDGCLGGGAGWRAGRGRRG